MHFRISAILTALFLSQPLLELWAAPPHSSLQEKIKRGEVVVPKHDLEISQKELSELGFDLSRFKPSAPSVAGPFRMLVLLVDFSDERAQTAPVSFDSLLFSKTQSSVRRYYLENSYGVLDLVTVNYPSALGWRRAPQSSSYYADSNYGLGSYPQNARKLVEDAVDLADPLVNFADYDNNADGYVDGVAVVHAGPGAEYTGNSNDIWSHKWAITPRLKDGVYVYSYTMEPEYWISPGDMTIGVFCHEFGHLIGNLPDLYDLDGGSQGIGRWSLMAGGTWNGNMGSSPSHFDAWCKIRLGFAASNVVSSDRTAVPIPSAEKSKAGIFRLWTDGSQGPEYFLVENRQRTGYDAALPSSGLLIWHIDDTVSTTNRRPWYPPNSPATGHYQVALVQADNLYHLEKNLNGGDAGDPFPGSTTNRTFNSASLPNSLSYTGLPSFVRVENISASKDTMTADLFVRGSSCVAIKGDLNGDAALTAADVSLLLSCVFQSLGNCNLCVADVDCDGTLAPGDLVLQLNAVFLALPFPC